MELITRRLKNIRHILFKEQNQILSAVSALIILSLLTKFSGLLFKALQASQFGASRENDIFNAANAIPEMITITILTGAVAGTIIPVLMRSKHNDSKEDFDKFFSTILNIGGILFVVVSIFIVLFSNDLIFLARDLNIISPPHDPFTTLEYEQIAHMMKLLMIPQAILGVSAYISSTLNVFERFIIPSLAGLFYNIGRIIGVTIIVDLIGGSNIDAIYGIVWGTMIGAILHLGIQIPLITHIGVGYKFVIDWSNKYLMSVVKLSLPRIFSLAGEQLSILFNKVIALNLVAGSLSALDYAFSLVNIPLSLIGATFAVAAFPSMSKFYENNDKEKFSQIFRKVINQIFFLAIPVAVIIFVLRIPLTRLFFGILGGNFSWENTQQVAWIIFFLSIGLAFETMRSFMFRTFYATHDSRKPLIVSIIVMFVGIVSAIMLSNYFSHFNTYDVNDIFGSITFTKEVLVDGVYSTVISPQVSILPGFSIDMFFTRGNGVSSVGGLALSSSLVFTLEFILLFIFLWRKQVIDGMEKVLGDFGRKILAGVSMLIISYGMFRFWEGLLNTSKTLSLGFLTVIIMVVALLFYLWISLVLNIEEVDQIIDYIVIAINKLQKRFPIVARIRKMLKRI